MERMTRMSKYKDLREHLKNDVVTTQETKTYVTNQEVVKDANYYRNLVGDQTEQQVEIKNPIKEDTLIESLTFETITENETEEVKTALEKVRENNGQEQFNTRMDILNKIRQSKVETKVEIEQEVIEEILEDQSNKSENRFGYIKDENIEEDVEEENTIEKPQKRKGLFNKKDDEEIDEDEEIEEEDEDEEEEESSFMIKLLNGCIVVLVLVLIGLVGFIAKEVLF